MLGFVFLQLGFIINLKMPIPKPTQKTEFFGDDCGLDQYVELTTERQNLENKATLLLVFTREWQVNSFIIDSTDRNFHCVKNFEFVFNPNAGKYGPERLRIRTLVTQCFSVTV